MYSMFSVSMISMVSLIITSIFFNICKKTILWVVDYFSYIKVVKFGGEHKTLVGHGYKLTMQHL